MTMIRSWAEHVTLVYRMTNIGVDKALNDQDGSENRGWSTSGSLSSSISSSMLGSWLVDMLFQSRGALPEQLINKTVACQ